jgi:hypothetical protein
MTYGVSVAWWVTYGEYTTDRMASVQPAASARGFLAPFNTFREKSMLVGGVMQTGAASVLYGQLYDL